MESEFVAETLGEQVVEFFLGNKARSGRSTRQHLSEFELDRYLGVL